MTTEAPIVINMSNGEMSPLLPRTNEWLFDFAGDQIFNDLGPNCKEMVVELLKRIYSNKVIESAEIPVMFQEIADEDGTIKQKDLLDAYKNHFGSMHERLYDKENLDSVAHTIIRLKAIDYFLKQGKNNGPFRERFSIKEELGILYQATFNTLGNLTIEAISAIEAEYDDGELTKKLKQCLEMKNNLDEIKLYSNLLN